MKPIGVHLIGRFGNQMFQYAYARALAERGGRELHTNAWAGQKVFDINDPPLDGSEDMLPEHYRQDQDSLIYTRADAKRWFSWRYDVYLDLSRLRTLDVAAHIRRGDYARLGYPVISEQAVIRAATHDGIVFQGIEFVSEEKQFDGMMLPDAPFAYDFWRLASAKILFRSNSSFSWWAATLGNGRVFSPVIEGLKGGVEHDSVPFVEGNWPRLAELPGITDLHLPE